MELTTFHGSTPIDEKYCTTTNLEVWISPGMKIRDTARVLPDSDESRSFGCSSKVPMKVPINANHVASCSLSTFSGTLIKEHTMDVNLETELLYSLKGSLFLRCFIDLKCDNN